LKRTWREEAVLVLQQAVCPVCDAGKGRRCRTPGGTARRFPHKKRRIAAEGGIERLERLERNSFDFNFSTGCPCQACARSASHPCADCR